MSRVAIVGAGPVGLGLAIELGQRGIETTVLEQDEVVHRIPKGQNLTQRTMEHFRVWGVDDRIRAARLMPPEYPAAGVNAYGNLMSEFAHSWFKRSTVDDYYFASNERLPQYLTEEVLRERVSQLDAVDARYGVTVRSVEQGSSSVRAITDQGAVEAGFLVGCDGSRSIVRESAGIGERRTDHDRKMALLVFRSEQLHEILTARFGDAAFFNVLDPGLDGYWRFLGRVDVGEGWFFHAPVSDDSTAESLDHERLLYDTVGVSFEVDLDYVGFWNLRIAIANRYRSGRVFIAGDAAHSHPPYGGYGINTGLEDARNLGWKLAGVLAGWGGPDLLDSYDAERRAVFESTARDFIEAFIERDRRFIRAHDLEADREEFRAAWASRRSGAKGISDFEPHYEGSSIVVGATGGRPSAVGGHSFAVRPGHHLSPPRAGAGHSLLTALGDGFGLIARDADSATISSFKSASADLGVPLRVMTEREHPEIGAYEQHPFLIRPDNFVAWVADGSQSDLRHVLRRSVGGRQ